MIRLKSRRFRLLAVLAVVAALFTARYVYAATTLTRAVVGVTIAPIYQNDITPSVAIYEPGIVYTSSLTDGDAVNKAEVAYCTNDSVTASGTDSIDVAGGITDAFGNVLTIAKLKTVYVQNLSTTTTDIINVVRPATDGAAIFGADGDLSAVGPGGVFLWHNPSAAGVTVTGADTDNIDIVEVGGINTVAYRICVIGTD